MQQTQVNVTVSSGVYLFAHCDLWEAEENEIFLIGGDVVKLRCPNPRNATRNKPMTREPQLTPQPRLKEMLTLFQRKLAIVTIQEILTRECGQRKF